AHRLVFSGCDDPHPLVPSFPTRRSSDLSGEVMGMSDADWWQQAEQEQQQQWEQHMSKNNLALWQRVEKTDPQYTKPFSRGGGFRSEEHTSELQSRENLVCRLLLEQKNTQ